MYSIQQCLHNDLYHSKCRYTYKQRLTHTNIHLGKVTLTALMFKVRQTAAVHILNLLTLATVAIYQVVEFYSWFYSMLKYPCSFKAQHVTLILIMQRCVEEWVGGAFKNK